MLTNKLAAAFLHLSTLLIRTDDQAFLPITSKTQESQHWSLQRLQQRYSLPDIHVLCRLKEDVVSMPLHELICRLFLWWNPKIPSTRSPTARANQLLPDYHPRPYRNKVGYRDTNSIMLEFWDKPTNPAGRVKLHLTLALAAHRRSICSRFCTTSICVCSNDTCQNRKLRGSDQRYQFEHTQTIFWGTVSLKASPGHDEPCNNTM